MPSAHSRHDGELSQQIGEIHDGSRRTLGVPRVHAELKEGGERVGRKRVAPLMRSGPEGRKPALNDVHNPARPGYASVTGPGSIVISSQRGRALGGGHHRHPDVGGFLYLAVVLDVWSRRIVAWAMANYLRTDLVLDALDMAASQRRPTAVIQHSDQVASTRRSASAALPRGGSPTVDGEHRQLLRQCDAREFLRDARVRVARQIAASARRRRRRWACSTSSRVGTILVVGTLHSATCRQ